MTGSRRYHSPYSAFERYSCWPPPAVTSRAALLQYDPATFQHKRGVESAGVAGSGQSQPTEGHGKQPQHQVRRATDYSDAGAGTTCGDGQIEPTVARGD